MGSSLAKRVKKRTSSDLPTEIPSEDDSILVDSSGQSSSSVNTWAVPRQYAPIIYATTYFICMIVVDFTIEGTQNAFPDLLALPYAMTLFQFSFCFLMPVAISRGKTLQNLPTTVIKILPYIVLALVVSSSNVCKSASARYVSFPTKVMFRSTKLIPVMIVASIFKIGDQRKYGRQDYLAAFMLCAGAAGYSLGEHSLNDDKKDSYFGILLLSGSVLCDAFTPNIKQWLMNPTRTIPNQDESMADVDTPTTKIPSPKSPSSSLMPSSPDIIISDSSFGGEPKQVIARRIARKQFRFLKRGGLGLSAAELMTNAYAVGCVGLIIFMTITGHLDDAVRTAIVEPHLFANLSLIGIALSIAVFAHTRLIKHSGAVAAVTITTLREFFTVLLSYLIYPKIFSSLHAVSTLSVFGGIVLNVYTEFGTRPENSDNDRTKVINPTNDTGIDGTNRETELASLLNDIKS